MTQRIEPCLLTLLTDFGLDHVGAHLGLQRTLFKAAGVTKMYLLAGECLLQGMTALKATPTFLTPKGGC